MLSWSSTETGQQVDLAAVAAGAGESGWSTAARCCGSPAPAAARTTPSSRRRAAALVAETDEAFMVDAAAVAANFEMMTRLADGTGAVLTEERLGARRVSNRNNGRSRHGQPPLALAVLLQALSLALFGTSWLARA